MTKGYLARKIAVMVSELSYLRANNAKVTPSRVLRKCTDPEMLERIYWGLLKK